MITGRAGVVDSEISAAGDASCDRDASRCAGQINQVQIERHGSCKRIPRTGLAGGSAKCVGRDAEARRRSGRGIQVNVE